MSNKNKEPQQRDLKLSLLGYQLFDKLFLPLDRQREEAESKQAKRLRKAKEYLELHYMESISVGEAADYVDWHRAHFSKIFTSVYGVSPMQFLKELRMNNAQRLLQNTDHSITEISLSLGYQDLFTFTRAFTKHFGLSPSKYREQANLSPAAP
jgi:AraC-like DNA-binding protein